MSTIELQIVEHTRGEDIYWKIEFRFSSTEDWTTYWKVYSSFESAKKFHDKRVALDTITRTVVYP